MTAVFNKNDYIINLSTIEDDDSNYINRMGDSMNGPLSMPYIILTMSENPIHFSDGTYQNTAFNETNEIIVNMKSDISGCIESNININDKITNISYDDYLIKTTISNNCFITNLTCGNINTSHLSGTDENLQTQINSKESKDSSINANRIYNGSVDNLTFNYISELTSDCQAQIDRLHDLYNNLTNSYLPTGSILFSAKDTTAPNGFLFCWGQNISKTTYGALFAVIGNTFLEGRNGAATPTGTFWLPDLRQCFVKGLGDNLTQPTLRYSNIPTTIMGEFQDMSVQNHFHKYSKPSDVITVMSSTSTGSTNSSVWDNKMSTGIPTEPNVFKGSTDTVPLDNETRPNNISLNYIIKY